MKIYVCWTTSAMGGHACGRAYEAVKDAGHDPEVVMSYGMHLLPDQIFNRTHGRQRAKELTGSSMVPVLELDDGTAVAGSKEVIAWAKANPAAKGAESTAKA